MTPLPVSGFLSRGLLLLTMSLMAFREPTCRPIPVECTGDTCSDWECPQEMSYVPEGSFLMGSPLGEGDAPGYQYWWERPQHIVHVSAFCIDQFEDTVGEYAAFLAERQSDVCPTTPPQPVGPACVLADLEDETGQWSHPQLGIDGEWGSVKSTCQAVAHGPATQDCADHPVVYVSWAGADAFCRWQGLRLPTEAEWERAAKGDVHRAYVWGDEPPTRGVANCWDTLCADGFELTAPVGSFPLDRSPMGVFDMTGNVHEWVEDDWHDGYEGAPSDGSAWVQTPERATYRVVKGGDLGIGVAAELRTSVRGWADYRGGADPGFGFRCATSAP